MARPLEFDRDKAVEIAMNQFWKNGYKASSVKSLSETLGITRSSFYNAFGSRQALFKEALALYFEQSPDMALARAEPGVAIKKLFTQTFRAACEARASDGQARGCLAVNCMSELGNAEDGLGDILATLILESVDRIEQLLGWGVTQGEIEKHTDLHALALALQNLLVGLNVMSKVVHDEQELWKFVQITLKGLGLLDEEV